MAGLYAELLRKWCDGLLSLQVTGKQQAGLHGGILCPSCSLVHGRCADAVYPLMHMAGATGDGRYLDAAVKLQAWSDHVTRPDGSWVNDAIGHGWKGITVFGTIALGEALRHHGEIVEKAVRDRWTDRLRRAAEFLHGFVTWATGVINYPVTCSAAMAVAGQVLQEKRDAARARLLAHGSLAYFSKQGKLLFGEGHPQDGLSPRNCRAVDLGYNVEESLPGLVLYGKIAGDEEILDFVAESLRSHLEFMLPDGAWDNSWGTRNYKWTYWGSRTSDGCQGAYALLADRDPRFAAAAMRNARLLDTCTHDGILYGGPHYYKHGELPCVHHTFCHAKALAAALDHGADAAPTGAGEPLPREAARGVREFPEILTWLIATGPWCATVTAYDWLNVPEGHASGGALCMLWHEAVGPVLAASMTEYSLPEPQNMQPQRDPLSMCLTPRLELRSGEGAYRSVNDFDAKVQCSRSGDQIKVSVSGRLVDKDQAGPPSGALPFRMHYRFTKDALEIGARLAAGDADRAEFLLPVISSNDEQVRRVAPGEVEIAKPGGRVNVSANAASGLEPLCEGRIFNHVPGFEAIPLVVKLAGQSAGAVQIRIAVC